MAVLDEGTDPVPPPSASVPPSAPLLDDALRERIRKNREAALERLRMRQQELALESSKDMLSRPTEGESEQAAATQNDSDSDSAASPIRNENQSCDRSSERPLEVNTEPSDDDEYC